MSNYMSAAQYAKHRMVDRSTVKQWLNEGKLNNCVKIGSNNRKLIDQDRADKVLGGKDLGPEKINHNSSDNNNNGNLTRARAAKTAIEAKNAQLKFEAAAGRLVSKDAVEDVATQMATITRESLLTIPDRISSQLSAMTDISEINILIRGEIEIALDNLSKSNFNFFSGDNLESENDDE